jgi:hypothetical protein
MASRTPAPKAAAKPANTQVSIAGQKVPRLPNERDESTDSSGERPRTSMKQAHADLKRGLVDTDKGPVMDEAYKAVKGGKEKTA